MSIYYAAVDFTTQEWIEPPDNWANKSPGLYHPENPFPGMVIMMNSRGSEFEIINDSSAQDTFYSDLFKDITEEVYAEYKETWAQFFKEKEK